MLVIWSIALHIEDIARSNRREIQLRGIWLAKYQIVMYNISLTDIGTLPNPAGVIVFLSSQKTTSFLNVSLDIRKCWWNTPSVK